jgi:hypothetical protein
MRTLVGAVNDFRGTYDVSDYRWFNLRDGDSTSPNFQVRYGLMHDDYGEKPAFAVYRDLISKLSVRASTGPGGPPAGGPPPPILRVRCVRHGWRAGLGHPPARTRRVDFLLDGRLARRDRRAPFRATLLARNAKHRRVHTVTARVRGRLRLSLRVRACRHTATYVSSTG